MHYHLIYCSQVITSPKSKDSGSPAVMGGPSMGSPAVMGEQVPGHFKAMVHLYQGPLDKWSAISNCLDMCHGHGTIFK